jgi:hypothetical protein
MVSDGQEEVRAAVGAIWSAQDELKKTIIDRLS